MKLYVVECWKTITQFRNLFSIKIIKLSEMRLRQKKNVINFLLQNHEKSFLNTSSTPWITWIHWKKKYYFMLVLSSSQKSWKTSLHFSASSLKKSFCGFEESSRFFGVIMSCKISLLNFLTCVWEFFKKKPTTTTWKKGEVFIWYVECWIFQMTLHKIFWQKKNNISLRRNLFHLQECTREEKLYSCWRLLFEIYVKYLNKTKGLKFEG